MQNHIINGIVASQRLKQEDTFLKPDTYNLIASDNICTQSDYNVGQCSTVHLPFLGDSLAKFLIKNKSFGVLSAHGTGKTTAVKEVINSMTHSMNNPAIAMIFPRTLLSVAVSSELNLNNYQAIKKANHGEQREMLHRMGGTPNFLSTMHKIDGDMMHDLLVLDESESIVSLLVSDAIEDPVGAIKTLRASQKNGSKIVLMDAAYGEKSKALAKVITGKDMPILKNDFKKWQGSTIHLLDGKKIHDRISHIKVMVLDDIKNNRPFVVAYMSAAQAKIHHKELVKKHPDKNIKLIDPSSGELISELIKNPDTVKKIDGLIYTPALDVGFSLDVKNYIHNVYGVASNRESTGDVDSFIQSIVRTRNPISKSVIVALDDERVVYKNTPKHKVDISNAVVDRVIMAHKMSGDKGLIINTADLLAGIDDNELALNDLYSASQMERFKQKNSFKEYFLKEVKRIGFAVNDVSISDLEGASANAGELEAQRELTETVKKDIKEKAIIDTVTAPKIDAKEYTKLTFKIKIDRANVTSEQIKSVERHRIERDLCIDFDKLKDKELDKVFKLKDDFNIMAKVRHNEQSCMTREDRKKYMSARLFGVGDNSSFKTNIINDRLNFPIMMRLFDYTQKYKDGKSFDHKVLSNKGGDAGLYTYLRRNKRTINALRIISLPKNWKSKPALMMKKLLELQGYNVKLNKKAGKYTASLNEDVSRILDARKEDGSNWVDRTMDLINEFGIIAPCANDDLSPMELIAALPKKLGVRYIEPPHVVAILKQFDNVPKYRQHHVAEKFINTAVNDSIDMAINELKVCAVNAK